MKFEVYETFESAKELWQDFQRGAILYPFQTYEWLSLWYITIGIKEKITPYIVVARSEVNNQILLLLPLGIQKVAFIKKLLWLGGKVTDYHGPIISRDSTSNNEIKEIDIFILMKELVKVLPRFDLVYCDKMPAQIAGLQNPLLNKECYFQMNSLQLVIDTDWDTFIKNGLKTGKHKLLNNEKKLIKKGELIFSIAQTEEEIKELVLKMTEQKSHKYRYTNEMFWHPYYQDFYLKTALETSQATGANDLHIIAFGLRLNKQIIATKWAIEYRKVIYSIMASYDLGEIAKYSPGIVMWSKFTQWCFKNEMKVLDFTIGEEGYKKDWCNSEMKLYQYHWLVSIKGKLYWTVLSLCKHIIISCKRSVKRLLFKSKVLSKRLR